MPIYEYEPIDQELACENCRGRFEIIQGIDEEPLSNCPHCGQMVKKVISWCRAAVIEPLEEHIQVNSKISEYEKEGMWSHAAELADTHSEKTGDHDMKMRAVDNYEKAGYDSSSLEKHAKGDGD